MTPKKKTKVKGQNRILTTRLTDADLDRMAEITPEDVERIAALTRKRNPKLGALLDAQIKKKEESKNQPE